MLDVSNNLASISTIVFFAPSIAPYTAGMSSPSASYSRLLKNASLHRSLCKFAIISVLSASGSLHDRRRALIAVLKRHWLVCIFLRHFSRCLSRFLYWSCRSATRLYLSNERTIKGITLAASLAFSMLQDCRGGGGLGASEIGVGRLRVCWVVGRVRSVEKRFCGAESAGKATACCPMSQIVSQSLVT